MNTNPERLANTTTTDSARPAVLVVYHFFPHYRAGIIDELSKSEAYDYLFCGDSTDPTMSGIRAHAWKPGTRPIIVRSRYVWPGVLFQSQVVQLALTGRFDGFVFLGDPHFVTTWIAAILARLRRKRVLFWTHGWLRSADRSMKGRVRDAFFHLPHGLLLYGDRGKVIGIRRGFRAAALHVVYNSIPVMDHGRAECELRKLAQEARARVTSTAHEAVILCSGRVIADRRIDLLLEAIALLRKRGRGAHALLIGDGPDRAKLEVLAARLDVPVYWVGECYDSEQLAVWFSAADLSVIPHRSGLSVLQSLAYGTPVLTGDDPESEMPEWEAIQPGLTGGFYREGNVGSLADAIERWLSANPDRESVGHLCKASIDSRFNARHQAGVIERALRGDDAVDSAQVDREWSIDCR